VSLPLPVLTAKDFKPDQEVRWCPGCVDYSILAQVQRVFPTLGIPRENFAIVSGIGCSSRFPYYMNTYGVHGIHGRAPAIATGLKLARPELSVWVVTGDGDALAIGGNHLMHALRRNTSLKILLLNNRIYGLTKGQTSPTSEFGKKTKSTPAGSVEYPLRPVDIALGAGATFVARVMGNDAQMVPEVLRRAARHDGAAFIEFFQNCVIFNDGAFDELTDPANKADVQLRLEHGKPLRFGKDGSKGLVMGEDGNPAVVSVADVPAARLLVHDETSDTLPALLSRLNPPDFPLPLGILRAVEREPYERLVRKQIDDARAKRPTTLEAVLNEGQTWTVPGSPQPLKE
jgi:2-oxoglutarate/2-oxoacid ferredoxin oxidoreductase subunit beta